MLLLLSRRNLCASWKPWHLAEREEEECASDIRKLAYLLQRVQQRIESGLGFREGPYSGTRYIQLLRLQRTSTGKTTERRADLVQITCTKLPINGPRV